MNTLRTYYLTIFVLKQVLDTCNVVGHGGVIGLDGYAVADLDGLIVDADCAVVRLLALLINRLADPLQLRLLLLELV